MVQRVEAGTFRSLGGTPEGVISLAVGDPDMATPQHIVQALNDAVEAGYTHYSNRSGDPELRAALAAHLTESTGTATPESEVLITHGGGGGLGALMLSLLDPGDRVIIPEPSYFVYADIVRMAGAEPVFVSLDGSFHLDLDAIDRAAPGAKMIVICNPSNPTGAVCTAQELADLAGIVDRHQLWLLADEAYDHILFDERRFVSTLSLRNIEDRLLYCQTFSKTYAMAGWRIGYIKAPSQVITAANRIQQTCIGSLNSAVQRAALAALHGPTDWMAEVRDEYQFRRDLVVAQLSDTPGIRLSVPEGAFYGFVHTEVEPNELGRICLAKGVEVRQGIEFGPGGKDFVRISFAVSRPRLVEGLARLRTALIEYFVLMKGS
jgi:aspartate aminotransferase